MKRMWLVTIDGAPQRIDVERRWWTFNRIVRVNGEAVLNQRGEASLFPGDFSIGSAVCSIHTLQSFDSPGRCSLFVNGERVEPHDDSRTSVALLTSAAVSANSVGTLAGKDAKRDVWVFAVRVETFFSDARGMLRATTEGLDFKGFRAKDDLLVPLADVARIERTWSLLFPVHTVTLTDGKRLQFLTESRVFDNITRGSRSWQR
jgi:hypothetical protein